MVANKLNGIGRKVHIGATLGFVEEGQFQGNLLNGFGREIWSDGDLRIGQWKNDALHGYGKQCDKGSIIGGLW